MLFNSLHFLAFFALVSAAYDGLPHRHRWKLLLAASCWFYGVFVPAYLLVLFFLIAIDYGAGLLIERAEGRARKWLLAASLAANVSILGIFKYYDFFVENIAALTSMLGIAWQPAALGLLLPIGLSFHTFQSMAYTIEVYLGRQKAEKHLGLYGLYVLFYPQMVAGPIERPQNLLHQLRDRHELDASRYVDGLRLMLWGLFKKVVIADRLAMLVDPIYADVDRYGGWSLALATYAFALQIYCDFSGYSDIAIGAARTMGIDLMKNFDRPYSARSIAEFWKRWHISLSTWFRDYLYIPLGGNRVPLARQCVNLFIVFLVSGLWHGAEWTFVVWGALHGTYLIAGLVTRPWRSAAASWIGLTRWPRLLCALQLLVTFHLVTFSWIFFRAKDLGEAWLIVAKIATASGPALALPPLVGAAELAIIAAALVGLRLSDGKRCPPAVHAALAAAVVLFGRFRSHDFIYFQF